MPFGLPFSYRPFPLGKYVTNLSLFGSSKKEELQTKITLLDNVMYYDQHAAAFVIAMLAHIKNSNNRLNGSSEDANTAFNVWVDFSIVSLPTIVTFVNGILKKMRDDAATELNNPASHSLKPM